MYTKTRRTDSSPTLYGHVTHVCEAHDRVILTFFKQVQGLAKSKTDESRDNFWYNVHMERDVMRKTHSQSVTAGAID